VGRVVLLLLKLLSEYSSSICQLILAEKDWIGLEMKFDSCTIQLSKQILSSSCFAPVFAVHLSTLLFPGLDWIEIYVRRLIPLLFGVRSLHLLGGIGWDGVVMIVKIGLDVHKISRAI